MPAPALTFTGERFTPEVRGAIWYEHWHRYAVVAPLAAGKRVLDAACGEGYGSAVLATRAARVTGVDANPEAHEHAKAKYTKPGVAFERDLVQTWNKPVDAVVFLQTIEHVAHPPSVLAAKLDAGEDFVYGAFHAALATASAP